MDTRTLLQALSGPARALTIVAAAVFGAGIGAASGWGNGRTGAWAMTATGNLGYSESEAGKMGATGGAILGGISTGLMMILMLKDILNNQSLMSVRGMVGTSLIGLALLIAGEVLGQVILKGAGAEITMTPTLALIAGAVGGAIGAAESLLLLGLCVGCCYCFMHRNLLAQQTEHRALLPSAEADLESGIAATVSDQGYQTPTYR